MDILITFVVMIVMLGILISTHELGHLIVAKAYNVYCLEYSIGMGPAIFKRKKEGGETAFSLRALPLGGYVMMYGEGVELPDGTIVPPERSINGIKWWKRCLIMSAGIAINILTALIFSFINSTCFPSFYSCSHFDTGITESAVQAAGEEEATARAFSFWVTGELGDYVLDYETTRLYSPDYAYDDNGSVVGFIIDCDTDINGEQYVAVFNLTSVINGNDLLTHTVFYPTTAGFYQNPVQKALRLDAKPSMATGSYKPKQGDVITMTPAFLELSGTDLNPTKAEFEASKDNTKTIAISVDENGNLQSGSDVIVHCHQYWLPFGERVLNGCSEFKYLFTATGEGLKAIFTGHLENVGSIVAAGSMVSSISSEIGWIQTFFFYGGFLSLNLAIFNLLPFPGLDGYQLLVTIVEAAFRKKIPEKIKNGISLVGVGLLMAFSIFIILRDVLRFF